MFNAHALIEDHCARHCAHHTDTVRGKLEHSIRTLEMLYTCTARSLHG